LDEANPARTRLRTKRGKVCRERNPASEFMEYVESQEGSCAGWVIEKLPLLGIAIDPLRTNRPTRVQPSHKSGTCKAMKQTQVHDPIPMFQVSNRSYRVSWQNVEARAFHESSKRYKDIPLVVALTGTLIA
jgi:hypothetical protein